MPADITLSYEDGQFYLYVDGLRSPISAEDAVRLRDTLHEALRVVGLVPTPIEPARGPFDPPQRG